MPRRERPVLLERMRNRTFLSKKYSLVKYQLKMLTLKVRPRLPGVRTLLLFCICRETISQVLPHCDFRSCAAHHGSVGEAGKALTRPTLQRRSSERRGHLPGVRKGTLGNLEAPDYIFILVAMEGGPFNCSYRKTSPYWKQTVDSLVTCLFSFTFPSPLKVE